MLDVGHKNRLTVVDLKHFAGDSLFDKVARAVCAAGVLPRKELYESWEVARRVHRLVRRRRRRRVVDLCCGHGLVGALLLILDGELTAGQGIDRAPPPSTDKLHTALRAAFPRAARMTVQQGAIEDVALDECDVVVSAHACGGLTDVVLDKAVAAGSFVAVLPCCHVLPHRSEGAHPLAGWLDGALAIDVDRAARLCAAGYTVQTQRIDEAITPKNRLLLGAPTTLPTTDATE